MEWNLDMGPNAVLFFSHSEVVSGCYLILALNIKGSGLLLGNVDSRKFSAERKRGKAVDPTRLCDAELSANSFFFFIFIEPFRSCSTICIHKIRVYYYHFGRFLIAEFQFLK